MTSKQRPKGVAGGTRRPARPALPAPILTSAGRIIDNPRKVMSDVTSQVMNVPALSTTVKRGRLPLSEGGTSRMFLITFRLGKFSLDRESVVAFSPDCTEFCVTLEQGSGTCCENHVHCYFNFVNSYKYVDLITYYSNYFDSVGLSFITIHIEKVMKLRNFLSYMTKVDINPYFFGVNENSFSFNYHANKELSKMTVWDVSHWFIVLHRNYYKFLEQLWIKLHSDYCKYSVYIWPWISYDLPWCLSVEKWYIDFVSCKYYHKKKHLYLYGDSNVGKSTLVRYFLRDLGNRVYYAADAYPFGGYNSSIHRCVVFDEFYYKNYDMQLLNRFLEGSEFYCNQKYIPERLDRNESPCIIISNYPPPQLDYFINRLLVINADLPLQFFDRSIEEVDSIIIAEDSIENVLSEEDLP